MPLLALGRQRDRVIPGSGSVMDRLLAAGLPVASSCSGRGACGRCAVEVLAGLDDLSPPSARETRTLARNRLGAPVRLACLCRVRHPGRWILVRASYW